MAKRTRVAPNNYIQTAVQLLPEGVDEICNETALKVEEAGRQVMLRAQELSTKLNNLAQAMREHAREAHESITKYGADIKHTADTVDGLIDLHQGETTLDLIEDRQAERLPRAGNIPERPDEGNGFDHPHDLDEHQG